MAATFKEAYGAARDSYGERWAEIEVMEQTAAIYREMRRIDAEHAAGSSPPEKADAASPVSSLS